ncbi:hypothetical protein ACG92U_02155 [Leuconostoc citreum]
MPIESWFLTAYYLGGRSGNEINAITDKYHNYDQRKAYIREKLFEKFAALKLTGIIRTWHNKINVLFGIKTDFGMQYFNSFRKNQMCKLKKIFKNLSSVNTKNDTFINNNSINCCPIAVYITHLLLV